MGCNVEQKVCVKNAVIKGIIYKYILEFSQISLCQIRYLFGCSKMLPFLLIYGRGEFFNFQKYMSFAFNILYSINIHAGPLRYWNMMAAWVRLFRRRRWAEAGC